MNGILAMAPFAIVGGFFVVGAAIRERVPAVGRIFDALDVALFGGPR